VSAVTCGFAAPAIDAPDRFAHTGPQSRVGRASDGSRRTARLDEGIALIAEIEVGAVIDGTVARITPYGAFLQLEDGRLGLVHISEVDRNYVKDVHDHLREGDVVQAKVVAIKEDGKIDLSI
jgi:ribosomal protein S1